MSFYELQCPSEWADPPSTWSSTTLDDVEACPRRWQLLRSRWGEHTKFPVRPNPAAAEGQIVHDALDRLTRACGQHGNPAFGSPEFANAAADADFFPGFTRAVTEWQQQLTAHPKPGPPFRLRVTAEELANRAVRLFREQYRPNGRHTSQPAERATEKMVDVMMLLRQKRALSEVKLKHPTLSFLGALDRVQVATDGVEIVDFKTGRPDEKHHHQLLRYAVLWWRTTGELPVRLSAQYLDGAASWPVAQGELLEIEAEIAARIPALTEELRDRPAKAAPGLGCQRCPVRARCSAGWANAEEAALADGRGDAELVVTMRPGDHGFLARSRAGAEVSVVYETAVAKLLPALDKGHVLRVLDGVWREKRSQLELKAWTEVFYVRK
ncbi:MAG: PD-(D/E)XK nuclease family protein [Myxococcales bacterium]|nr:PD-(D/E)XK nuclease family protein [Myxococcales bacterium]